MFLSKLAINLLLNCKTFLPNAEGVNLQIGAFKAPVRRAAATLIVGSFQLPILAIQAWLIGTGFLQSVQIQLLKTQWGFEKSWHHAKHIVSKALLGFEVQDLKDQLWIKSFIHKLDVNFLTISFAIVFAAATYAAYQKGLHDGRK